MKNWLVDAWVYYQSKGHSIDVFYMKKQVSLMKMMLFWTQLDISMLMNYNIGYES